MPLLSFFTGTTGMANFRRNSADTEATTVASVASYCLPGFIYADLPSLACASCARQGDQVIGMKINIDELTYEEIKDVVDRLRQMKIEAKFRRVGATIMLQTEQGTVQVAQNEAVELYGIPAVF